jgi:hypothetical protein
MISQEECRKHYENTFAELHAQDTEWIEADLKLMKQYLQSRVRRSEWDGNDNMVQIAIRARKDEIALRMPKRSELAELTGCDL